MRVLIYGFGRMGLTHFAILNSIAAEIEFTIIEPNKILRMILKRNIRSKILVSDASLKDPFDITIITTPPFVHNELLNKSIERGDKKIFVEKPFGGHTNLNGIRGSDSNLVGVGYVLRFNPCIQWVKANIDPRDIKSIHGQYLSNTIEKKPTGWRNGSFSGVLNEMGSHIIDLIQYIIGTSEMAVLSAKTESVITDVDDIVEASLRAKTETLVSIYLNWVKKDVRKPVFGIDIFMKSGIQYAIDQQQINKYSVDKDLIEKISVVDLAKDIPFYLRGVDFSEQMVDLVGNQDIMATANDALGVNGIMSEILNYENNTRR